MSREYLNENSRNRRDIHEPPIRTMKFKVLFGDYEEFKTKLSVFGFTEEILTEPQFMMLQTMLGNTYLRYKTDVKNLGHIAFRIKQLYAKFLKEQKLYDVDLDLLLSSVAENEQKFYSINKSDVGEVTDHFLDNSVRSKLTNKEPIINRLQEIINFNKMELPELTYLSRISSSIVYPLQPIKNNRTLGGKYDRY